MPACQGVRMLRAASWWRVYCTEYYHLRQLCVKAVELRSACWRATTALESSHFNYMVVPCIDYSLSLFYKSPFMDKGSFSNERDQFLLAQVTFPYTMPRCLYHCFYYAPIYPVSCCSILLLLRCCFESVKAMLSTKKSGVLARIASTAIVQASPISLLLCGAVLGPHILQKLRDGVSAGILDYPVDALYGKSKVSSSLSTIWRSDFEVVVQIQLLLVEQSWNLKWKERWNCVSTLPCHILTMQGTDMFLP